MKTHAYLSLLPEALVASNLGPEDYGAYLATGSKKRSRGQAFFFELHRDYAQARLTELGAEIARPPEPESVPRRSEYLTIYRALESTRIDALEALHLVTDDGRVLTLLPSRYDPIIDRRFFLYQEFAPVQPRVVSTLEPREFARRITHSKQKISLPALVFADLRLGNLRDDPEGEGIGDLPYPNLEHLRDCLRELDAKPQKTTKTVVRYLQQDVLFRTVQRGFYVAAANDEFRYFPMPSRVQLETIYYPWWRSALSTFGA